MSLFTADTHFVVFMNAKNPTPSQELHSREALAPVFADLNKYHATMHFLGQTPVDDRGPSLPRWLREGGRRLAVRGAPALCRLDRGARPVMATWAALS